MHRIEHKRQWRYPKKESLLVKSIIIFTTKGDCEEQEATSASFSLIDNLLLPQRVELFDFISILTATKEEQRRKSVF
jgi:hypothetical protein